MRDELLTVLMEECAEVIVECSKIIRFDNDGEALAKELGDLYAMVELAQKADLITWQDIEQQIPRKLNKLRSWSKLGGLINEVQSND